MANKTDTTTTNLMFIGPRPSLARPSLLLSDWDYVTLPDENTHSILFSDVDDFVAVEVAFT